MRGRSASLFLPPYPSVVRVGREDEELLQQETADPKRRSRLTVLTVHFLAISRETPALGRPRQHQELRRTQKNPLPGDLVR
jgi:hypothetical protein